MCAQSYLILVFGQSAASLSSLSLFISSDPNHTDRFHFCNSKRRGEIRETTVMKNLCRKGRVHPSAATCKDFYAVLRLLPVAVTALSAALPPEDQEVLAYLTARSPDVSQQIDIKKHCKLRKNAEPDDETAFSASSFETFAETEAMLRRSPSGQHKNSPKNSNSSAAVSVSNSNNNTLRTHPASFECSCFQCYMSFWSRWDASPSREAIHEAIDLFEELMAAESSSAKNNKHRKGFKKEEKIDEVVIPQGIINNNNNLVGDSDLKVEDEATPAVSKSAAKAKQIVPLAFNVEDDDETEETVQTVTEQARSSRAGACPFGGRSLMRRMFPDIMGFVADHLWTAWSNPARASHA